MTDAQQNGHPLTGRKVLAIAVTAFGIIIAVNVFMAVQAVRTFPGLEVKNSYVASQSFDADRAAQERLGWKVTPVYDGRSLRLDFTGKDGARADVAEVSAIVGRSTMSAQDQKPAFARDGDGYVAPVELAPGNWIILLEARAGDGTRFHQRLDLRVKVEG